MKQISEYEKQATDFLEKTNTSFDAKFLKFGPHFEEEEQHRNIFEITLKNNNGEFKFNFGSSIVDSCELVPVIKTQPEHEVYCGIKIGQGKNAQFLSVKFNATVGELHSESLESNKMECLRDEWNEKASKIKKKVNSRYVQVNIPPFRKVCKEALSRTRIKLWKEKTYANIQANKIKSPTAYDVLTGLTKYDVGTFENFCGDFGYDTDSRKAEGIYEAVVDEYNNIAMLWNEQEIEELHEIQ